jgi:serpin B
MHRTGEMTYLEQAGTKGVLLPYVDERFAFFAVLPEDGQDPRQLVADADGSVLSQLFDSARSVPVTLSLPQFEVNYSDSLVDEMKALGMGVAFGAEADFSLMTPERSKDLFITEIRHKTYFKINEVGTEAAAATLVEIGKTAVPGADIVLDFNRPFLYGIVDQNTGMPVFIGILENPAAADA